MAKAHSPVRLDARLMEDAALNARLCNRSTAETIEYWAGLGKRYNKLIDPEVLLEIQVGSLQIEIKPTEVERIDSASVFGDIEERRTSSTLSQLVNRKNPVYQTSQSHPGLLEQVMPDGSVSVGRFSGGEFHKEV
ncbi:MAG: hypothetical protein V7744_06290 [Pseudomonadales bacterium]